MKTSSIFFNITLQNHAAIAYGANLWTMSSQFSKNFSKHNLFGIAGKKKFLYLDKPDYKRHQRQST